MTKKKRRVCLTILLLIVTIITIGQTPEPLVTYEYQEVSSVESIVPDGLKRSSLIANRAEIIKDITHYVFKRIKK